MEILFHSKTVSGMYIYNAYLMSGMYSSNAYLILLNITYEILKSEAKNLRQG